MSDHPLTNVEATLAAYVCDRDDESDHSSIQADDHEIRNAASDHETEGFSRSSIEDFVKVVVGSSTSVLGYTGSSCVENLWVLVCCIAWESVQSNKDLHNVRKDIEYLHAALSLNDTIENLPKVAYYIDNLFKHFPNQTWPGQFLTFVNGVQSGEPKGAFLEGYLSTEATNVVNAIADGESHDTLEAAPIKENEPAKKKSKTSAKAGAAEIAEVAATTAEPTTDESAPKYKEARDQIQLYWIGKQMEECKDRNCALIVHHVNPYWRSPEKGELVGTVLDEIRSVYFEINAEDKARNAMKAAKCRAKSTPTWAKFEDRILSKEILAEKIKYQMSQWNAKWFPSFWLTFLLRGIACPDQRFYSRLLISDASKKLKGAPLRKPILRESLYKRSAADLTSGDSGEGGTGSGNESGSSRGVAGGGSAPTSEKASKRRSKMSLGAVSESSCGSADEVAALKSTGRYTLVEATMQPTEAEIHVDTLALLEKEVALRTKQLERDPSNKQKLTALEQAEDEFLEAIQLQKKYLARGITKGLAHTPL